MKIAIKLLFATVSIALITACGGGGGGTETAENSVSVIVPLQTALKNIYAVNWNASGAITGRRNAPGTCPGGFCNSQVGGNFTRTTSVSGLNTTTNYAQSILIHGEIRGRNVSYTTSFSSDYSKLNFGNCQTSIPVTVSIGYVKVECVTMTVNSANSPNIATLQITSSIGTETYLIASNGSVTPVKAEETGRLLSDQPWVDYSLTMNF